MTKNIRMSVRQFTVLILLYTIGTTILVIPSSLAVDAKQNAWIAAAAGCLISTAIVGLYIWLGGKLGDRTLIEYVEYVFGKWMSVPLTVLFLFFSFIGSATVLFYIGNFMTTQVMPETPIESIVILFTCIIVMGLLAGLEVLARAAEILMPWFLLLFIVSTLFLIPEIEIEKIQPVTEIGLKPILKASLSYIGTASLPLLVFLMVFPAFIHNRAKAKKGFLIGNLLGGLFIIIITFLSISILGADFTERNLYPSYALAKKINVGDFIQRVEILMAGMWFITIFFKISLYSYSFVTGLAQLCGIKEYRPLVIPFGILLIVYSLTVYPDVVYMMDFDSTVYIPYILSIALLLPAFILAAGIVKENMSK
ncbi:GerAB/ArcD/ProY family transporter [Paenibacillus harenae]|uniref:Spore germination protein KB n=1 Tax=Paenibacillus harenae TaxID=306543 RepID=A0ABT9U912_PAEHA|nr:endospore germination permease [Paenibacillus harenae]MDQ0116137.1 spore germination protein KB [Paenibacillus harenae]